MGDGFVFPGSTAEEFWIGSYATTAAALRERLESFIIADDVTVHDDTAVTCHSGNRVPRRVRALIV